MEIENEDHTIDEKRARSQTPNQAKDEIGDLITEAKEEAETRTNGTRASSNDDESVGKGENKEHLKGTEDDTPKHDRPSERVREGQKWNDRPRKYENYSDRKPHKYDSKHDRAQYKKNIKSDLTSQKASSDPVAIRKQVELLIILQFYRKLMTEG